MHRCRIRWLNAFANFVGGIVFYLLRGNKWNGNAIRPMLLVNQFQSPFYRTKSGQRDQQIKTIVITEPFCSSSLFRKQFTSPQNKLNCDEFKWIWRNKNKGTIHWETRGMICSNWRNRWQDCLPRTQHSNRNCDCLQNYTTKRHRQTDASYQLRSNECWFEGIDQASTSIVQQDVRGQNSPEYMMIRRIEVSVGEHKRKRKLTVRCRGWWTSYETCRGKVEWKGNKVVLAGPHWRMDSAGTVRCALGTKSNKTRTACRPRSGYTQDETHAYKLATRREYTGALASSSQHGGLRTCTDNNVRNRTGNRGGGGDQASCSQGEKRENGWVCLLACAGDAEYTAELDTRAGMPFNVNRSRWAAALQLSFYCQTGVSLVHAQQKAREMNPRGLIDDAIPSIHPWHYCGAREWVSAPHWLTGTSQCAQSNSTRIFPGWWWCAISGSSLDG